MSQQRSVADKPIEVLAEAARVALHAPSVLNTQPWSWVLGADGLELRADIDRQLDVADPAGNLLLVSCGAALHHARLAIAAQGFTPLVQRFPDPRRPEALARLRVGERRVAAEDELAMYECIERRHTDRRPYSDEPVPVEAIDQMRAAGQREGVGLHRVGADQMPMLAIAVARAGAAEMADGDYRKELLRWVNRPHWSGDGVPPASAVAQVPRRVPVRQLTLAPRAGVPVSAGGDRGAAYLVVCGDGVEPSDWLRAGEGVSAVLLTAVAAGLSTAPISDVIEVADTRELVRGLLRGAGEPYLVIRAGYGPADPPAAAPRRDPAEAIHRVTEGDSR